MILFIAKGTFAGVCDHIKSDRIDHFKSVVKKSTVFYGSSTYPKLKVTSVKFPGGWYQSNKRGVVINEKIKLDFNNVYIKTGSEKFKNLVPLMGCAGNSPVIEVDFSKKPLFPASDSPQLFLANYCKGSLRKTRLLNYQEAYLFDTMGDSFCVEYKQIGHFDPHGFNDGRHSAPWVSTKNLYVIVAVPEGSQKEKYSVDIEIEATHVNDPQCLGCYPQVKCTSHTTGIKRKEPFYLPKRGRHGKVIPLTELEDLDFKNEVKNFVVRAYLKLNGKTIEEKSWEINWPQCM